MCRAHILGSYENLTQAIEALNNQQQSDAQYYLEQLRSRINRARDSTIDVDGNAVPPLIESEADVGFVVEYFEREIEKLKGEDDALTQQILEDETINELPTIDLDATIADLSIYMEDYNALDPARYE